MEQGAVLQIEIKDDQAQCRVKLRGELDLDTAGQLSNALREAQGSGAEWLVVDLAELEFIDSTGIQALLIAHRSANSDGQRLSFTHGRPQVERVLRLCGLDTEFEFLG